MESERNGRCTRHVGNRKRKVENISGTDGLCQFEKSSNAPAYEILSIAPHWSRTSCICWLAQPRNRKTSRNSGQQQWTSGNRAIPCKHGSSLPGKVERMQGISAEDISNGLFTGWELFHEFIRKLTPGPDKLLVSHFSRHHQERQLFFDFSFYTLSTDIIDG